jgi:hypothetical protein
MNEKTDNDTVTMGPQIAADGTRLGLRQRGSALEEVHVVPLVDGRPMSEDGEILSLSHRQGDVYDVIDSYKTTRSGPAQVATKAYRTGYDRIFGGKAAVGQA